MVIRYVTGASMSVAKLKRLIPPPHDPIEVGTLAEFSAVEKRLGVKLPRDYRDFVMAYGSGLFAGFYRVYNPFAASEYINLERSIHSICAMNREAQLSYLDHRRYPLPYFPPVGGLLPWGNDENGNDYYWLTEGTPSRWTVVQQENRGAGVRKKDFSMSEFLVAILEKRTRALAGGYPRADCFRFDPYRE